MTTLVFEDYPQGYIVSYLYKLPRALSLSRMLAEFFFRILHSTMCRKIFQFMKLTFLENALIRGILPEAHAHSPTSSCHHTPGRRKLLTPPGISKICFPQNWVKKTRICFIKIQSENMKMT